MSGSRKSRRYSSSPTEPALTYIAYDTVVVALLVVCFVTGSAEIYIDGAPTTAVAGAIRGRRWRARSRRVRGAR